MPTNPTSRLGDRVKASACVTLGAAVLALSACSSAGPHAADRTATTSTPITGGDSANASFVTTLPEAAVGSLLIPLPGGKTSGCSGTLILRNVVLTAAHCFVNNGAFVSGVGSTFTLPIPPNTFQTFNVGSFQAIIVDIANQGNNPSETDSQQDIAVAFLTTNVTTTQLPNLPDVYTGSDFPDVIFNSLATATSSPLFFPLPARIVGFDGSAGTSSPVRRAGTVVQLTFDQDCGFLGLGGCSGYWMDSDQGNASAWTQSGDSGGPISFMHSGQTKPTIFGVDKLVSNNFIGANESTWSPTWNNATGNGTWSMQWLQDADHDGVLDSVDNCNPAKFCPDNPARCANADQADDDGDGVGDVCDNCTGSACAGLGVADVHLFE